MGFSAKQTQALKRNLNSAWLRTRHVNGRELTFIEGWHAIAEANRIFGHDGWNRETVDVKCVISRENRGTFLTVYVAKVRITVRAGEVVVREGHGTGEARGSSPGEAHDMAIKAAETDGTKRALATFGKPFGLALYLRPPQPKAPPLQSTNSPPIVPAETAMAANDHGIPTIAQDSPPMPAQPQGKPAPFDKSLVPAPEYMRLQRKPPDRPVRRRDRNHLRYVASQPCIVCGRLPSDPHHLRFMQPSAVGMKVSDEFTVPLCRTHHQELHRNGNEPQWWQFVNINAPAIAKTLWEETRKQKQLTFGANDK